MPKRVKIAMVGGGSYNWTPRLIRDIILTPGLERSDFRLLDINLQAAKETAAAARRMTEDWGLPATFLATSDEARAFDGADFVVITISTGGLDAMRHDVHLSERYGIFQTVGDTVGPGGWSRGLRNVPVFARLAAQIKKRAPRAAILNYTNPLSVLTRTLCMGVDQPVVGLCHGLFSCYRSLIDIFNLKSEEEVKVNVAGVNHFFWVLDLAIRGREGYAMLRRKMKGMSFADLEREVHKDEAGFGSGRLVAAELLEEFGRMPYLGDRHTTEFFSRYLAPDEERLARYGIVRTSVASRGAALRDRKKFVLDLARGKTTLEKKPSRETAADIMLSMSRGGEFVDVVNVPNRGQVQNLPMGAVVETLGVVNGLGFTPLSAGPLPQKILNVVSPHVANQELIVQAALEGDLTKAFDALINDPLCAHLSIPRIKKMGAELLDKTRAWLPQFYGKRKA